MPESSVASGHARWMVTAEPIWWFALMLMTGASTTGGVTSSELPATDQPMSWKTATVAGPGLWIDSPLLSTGVISALAVPGANLASSKCELLDPCCHGLGAYSLPRPPRTPSRCVPPTKTDPSVTCDFKAAEPFAYWVMIWWPAVLASHSLVSKRIGRRAAPKPQKIDPLFC